MNSKLIKILMTSCLVLMVVLLAEWFYFEYTKNQLTVSDTIDEQSNEDTQLPEIDLSVVPIDYYAELIEHPLFIQGRKPVSEVETIKVGLVDTGEIDDWVLVGIYSNADKLTALFKGLGQETKHQNKSQGDELSGWSIQEILLDKVIVERSGEKQSIMLRKPKPKPKAIKKPRPSTKSKLIRRKKKQLTSEKRNE